MTAAERYAAILDDKNEAFLESSFSAESLKGVKLYEVKADSGMIFKCRKPDGPYFAASGSMPMVLSNIVLDTEMTDKDKEAKFAAMSPVEQRAAIQATAFLVRYVCVEPRLIVGEVTNQKNAISVDVLSRSDFASLSKWAGGGDEASGLKTFRKKR